MTTRLTHLDLDALDTLRECDTDGTLIPELVDLFVSETPKRLGALRAAFGRASAQELTQEAHALKSGCAQLGARRMAEICQRLEVQGRIGSLEGAGPLLDELDGEFPAVVEALRALAR